MGRGELSDCDFHLLVNLVPSLVSASEAAAALAADALGVSAQRVWMWIALLPLPLAALAPPSR